MVYDCTKIETVSLTVGFYLRVAVRAGILHRKVKEMMTKKNVRKAGMWLQEELHFPAMAWPSSPLDMLPIMQLQSVNI